MNGEFRNMSPRGMYDDEEDMISFSDGDEIEEFADEFGEDPGEDSLVAPGKKPGGEGEEGEVFE